jgi:hypothetical protein
MFVSPVEAFQIAGHESFGSSWNEDYINYEDSEFQRVALNNLRKALESGEVQALWHRFDFEHPLKPIEAAGEFFKIDLDNDCINLSRFAGEPIQARIHVDDLKTFFRNNKDATSGSSVAVETACRRWIVARIKNGEQVSPTAFLWSESKHKFPSLAKRAFVRARKAAVAETGSTHLSKGGRPRNETSAQKT